MKAVRRLYFVLYVLMLEMFYDVLPFFFSIKL